MRHRELRRYIETNWYGAKGHLTQGRPAADAEIEMALTEMALIDMALVDKALVDMALVDVALGDDA